MTSSQQQTYASSAPMSNLSMGQHVFQAYNTNTSNGFYETFSLGPSHMQQAQRPLQQSHPSGLNSIVPQQQQQHRQYNHNQSHNHQQKVMHKIPSPVLSLPPGSQSTSRQDSAEYDEDSDDGDDDDEEEEEDTSEVMIPNDDIETRLKVAQEAQDAAASEGSNGVFACPYCDKRYNGKHARSIWRRHLQDKHAIPLSQQPRRTRWDGDVNRPKNAEERRQRMLESKRRWARKKRQAEKVGGGPKMLSASTREDSFSSEVSALEQSSFSAPVKKATSGANAKVKRQQKVKEPRPLKFHNITQGPMPPFADFGSGGNSGGGGMLWPTSGNGAYQSFSTTPSVNGGSSTNRVKSNNGGTIPTSYTFHNSNSIVMAQQQAQRQYQQPQPQKKSLLQTSKSPRKALSQIDVNSLIGRKLLSQTMQGNSSIQSEDMSMKMANSPQMTTMDLNRMTPLNRFSQAYPTPPSVGDAPLHDKKVFTRMMPAIEGTNQIGIHQINMPLISPPTSQHANDSSPSIGNGNSSALNMTAMSMKAGAMNPIYAPVHIRTDSKSQRSPSDNPFSLDRHKISPSTSVSRSILPDLMQPPISSSRLTSVLENSEHRLSPIQCRRTSEEENYGIGIASPKNRRLPPLVKTPLRALKMDDNPTPSNFMDFSGAGGASNVRRLRSAGGIDSWKGLMTPTDEMNDRMIGFTPLTVKTARCSNARELVSVTRPSRDNDQFSSPQHLNLTQSLGLAPHSTTKGIAYGSIGATPYINSFLNVNSPWPESVIRPMATSAGKRNRNEMSRDGEIQNDHGGDDEDDEEEDYDKENNGVFHYETPSRPAKHHRSTLLGSAGKESDDGSSPRATRSGRLTSSNAGQEQMNIKPLSFNTSNDRGEFKKDETIPGSDELSDVLLPTKCDEGKQVFIQI